jgi:hypothetical protein
MKYLRPVTLVWMLLTAACSPDTSENDKMPAAPASSTASTTAVIAEPMQLVPCSEAWYAEIEAALGTADGQGHGPDAGSDEWQSAIEFKLGVRGDPEVPARASEQWCAYIDQAWLASHQ